MPFDDELTSYMGNIWTSGGHKLWNGISSVSFAIVDFAAFTSVSLSLSLSMSMSLPLSLHLSVSAYACLCRCLCLCLCLCPSLLSIMLVELFFKVKLPQDALGRNIDQRCTQTDKRMDASKGKDKRTDIAMDRGSHGRVD